MRKTRVNKYPRRPSIPGCCPSGTKRESCTVHGRCAGCKEFSRLRQKEWRDNNLEACRAKQRARNTPQFEMYWQAKTRAKRKNVPFTIELGDITIPARCPILGISLFKSTRRGQCNNSPSLDRIIPEWGYVPGNVAVISALANRIKNNATPDQVMAVAIWMGGFVGFKKVA